MYTPEKGLHFYQAVRKCQEDSKSRKLDFQDMEFNGLNIRVSTDSNMDDLSIIYELKSELRRCKEGVGV